MTYFETTYFLTSESKSRRTVSVNVTVRVTEAMESINREGELSYFCGWQHHACHVLENMSCSKPDRECSFKRVLDVGDRNIFMVQLKNHLVPFHAALLYVVPWYAPSWDSAIPVAPQPGQPTHTFPNSRGSCIRNVEELRT